MKATNQNASSDTSLRNRVIVSPVYPLGGNYGGIIQAYALQRVIAEMGFEVHTINSSRGCETARLTGRYARHLSRRLRNKTRNAVPLNSRQTRFLQSRPQDFIDRHIRTVDLFGMSRRDRTATLSKTQAILVGSDQVWRGGYANVPDQLLQYAVDFPIIRASYAASFGADHPIRFSRRLIRKSRELAQLFNAISVREDSGIRICKNLWGMEAIQHVDPTLLLNRKDYEEIARKSIAADTTTENSLFAYILDQNPKTAQLVANLSARLQLPVSEFSMESPLATNELKTDPERYRMKSVEEWLRHFSQCDYVVTDSFHGTVFAIIFNKPFISIGNETRGLSRFESLLTLLDLESRLIDIESPNPSLDLTDIDWEAVASKLSAERNRSINYLRGVLRVHSGTS